MTICLDTSAWLEYFNAGTHGERIRHLLAGDEPVITPAVVAAQIVEAARLRKENSKTFLHFLQSKTRIAPVNADVARMAGKLNAAHGEGDWTMMESLILATARHHHARLLTADQIFQGLPQVEVLPPPP